jgi:ABC-type transport system involved in cytochrome c biogenesis ATPase subunit
VYGLFPKLRELRNRPGGYLSGGEQQMLTVARTLMGDPELLLLDEPSEGLAPLIVESLLDNVRALKAEGVTILMAEQGSTSRWPSPTASTSWKKAASAIPARLPLRPSREASSTAPKSFGFRG